MATFTETFDGFDDFADLIADGWTDFSTTADIDFVSGSFHHQDTIDTLTTGGTGMNLIRDMGAPITGLSLGGALFTGSDVNAGDDMTAAILLLALSADFMQAISMSFRFIYPANTWQFVLQVSEGGEVTEEVSEDIDPDDISSAVILISPGSIAYGIAGGASGTLSTGGVNIADLTFAYWASQIIGSSHDTITVDLYLGQLGITYGADSVTYYTPNITGAYKEQVMKFFGGGR